MSQSLSWIDSKTLQSALSRSHRTPGEGQTQPGRFEARRSDATFIDPAPQHRPDFGGAFAGRIQALAAWVDAQLSPERWYISDSEGLALHVKGASEAQVITAVALSRALRPLRSVLGPEPVRSVSLQLGDGRMMHILWCETAVGRVALAMENPRNVSQDLLGMLVDALGYAMDGRDVTA